MSTRKVGLFDELLSGVMIAILYLFMSWAVAFAIRHVFDISVSTIQVFIAMFLLCLAGMVATGELSFDVNLFKR